MNVDFAPNTLASFLYKTPAWLLLGASLCFLVLSFSAYQTWQTANTWYRQRQELEQAKSKLDFQLNVRKSSLLEPVSKGLIRQLNQQIDLLNIDWPTLLDVLEENRGDDVTLLDVTLNGVEKSLILNVEVQKIETVIHFLERLKRTDEFQSAIIVRHEVVQRNGLPIVRVLLQARWK